MQPSNAIEVIARGVLVSEGYVLLCHTKGAWNTYLPGGHVEHGESAPVALAREMDEELGRQVEVGAFLGVVEHAYERTGALIGELNLVFAMHSDELIVAVTPPSAEDYIEFTWQPLSELAAARLEPAVLSACLPDWLTERAETGWASSYGSGVR